MAGFQVTLHGRIWVTAEDSAFIQLPLDLTQFILSAHSQRDMVQTNIFFVIRSRMLDGWGKK
jgi:hypothetical protein